MRCLRMRPPQSIRLTMVPVLPLTSALIIFVGLLTFGVIRLWIGVSNNPDKF
ncbi:YnaM/YnfT family protein [Klebsiella sp. B345]|uniref:YnaM/YnfT family protein n=1 Tax=Klebsiella sp. B345 TaxID=2755398 RepID=UPI003DA7E0BF